MPLNNCEINLILTLSKACVISSAAGKAQFAITDTKPVVTLSSQDNAKLLEQVKCGFKRTTEWNKYQSKVTIQVSNLYLDFLIDPSFLEVDRFFLLSENEGYRIIHTGYYIPKVELNAYNVMTDRQKLFDQPVKNDMRTYDNIRQIATGQGVDNTTGCLLDYPYFKKH